MTKVEIFDLIRIGAGDGVTIFNLDSYELNPIILKHFSPSEPPRLIKAYYSGLLKQHDNDLDMQKDKAIPLDPDDKHGRWLIHKVQYWQIERIIRLISLLSHRPLPNYPLQLAWWVYCLEVYALKTDPTHLANRERPPLIVPAKDPYTGQRGHWIDEFTIQQIKTAFIIFCNVLYKECFKD